MINKIKLFFCFFFICIFFYLIVKYYLSDIVKNQINLNRTTLEKKIADNNLILPILKNDTNNVIEFNSGFNDNEKKKIKRNFWNLINNK